MKHIYVKFGLVLLSCFMLTTALHGSNSLYVKLKNGTEQSILLANIQKITFLSGDMVVSKADASVSNYSIINDIGSLYYASVSTDIIVPELNEAIGVKLFPNPTANDVTISSRETILEVNLYRLSGSMVKRIFPNSSETTLQLSDCVTGIYIVEVVTNSGTTVKKVVKN